MRYTVYNYPNPKLGIREPICELKNVTFSEASAKFHFCTSNVGARCGLTIKVTIVDENDAVVAEWVPLGGIVTPKNNA